MTGIGPSSRLKLRRDAFVVPDGQGGVYFRNNEGSFQMEGRSIEQWIERLLPVFDGRHVLGDLVEGLPPEYQERILEISEVLYRNGFVRDVSTDLPHNLPGEVLASYAGQIEMVDTLGSSAEFHFEQYRNTRFLVMGCGGMLPSLVSALLASGAPKIQVMDIRTCKAEGGKEDSPAGSGDSVVHQRIRDIANHAKKSDAFVRVSVADVPSDGISWAERVADFDVVLFASALEDAGTLLEIEQACRQTGKVFAPVVLTTSVALIGPIVRPESTVGWTSAWHRLHQQALQDSGSSQESFVAESLAGNVLVFDLFKTLTHCQHESTDGRFYLLNLETLEGTWYTCLAHPVEAGLGNPSPISDLKRMIEDSLNAPLNAPLTDSFHDSTGKMSPFEWLPYFAYLTNAVSGIFHTWDEGECEQLPLSTCSVEVVDVLAKGPATLLPEQTVAGLTHEEARLEAGFTGIEQYAFRQLEEWLAKEASSTGGRFSGAGCGRTLSESVWRALSHALMVELIDESQSRTPRVAEVTFGEIEDNACRFYLNVLQAMHADVFIGVGETLHGLPVLWVGEPGNYYGSIGLNETMALQNALQAFVLDKAMLRMSKVHPDKEENGSVTGSGSPAVIHIAAIQRIESDEVPLSAAALTHPPEARAVQDAIDTISSHGVRFQAFDAAVEPFLQNLPGGVVAVVLERGKSS